MGWMAHPRRMPALAVLALVAWLAAMVAAPAMLPPGTVIGLDGRENRLDHADTWLELPAPAGLVYAVGDLLCHQKSWRSFSLHGNQLPVDERMSAIFAAALPGLLLSWRAPVGPYIGASLDAMLPARWRAPDAPRAARRWVALVCLALAPAALDVAREAFFPVESTAALRVASGAIAGIAGGLVLGAFLASLDHVARTRLTRRSRRAT